MFAEIYPPKNRTLEHAGIHLAEEVGELSEAMLVFRGHHSAEDFKNIELEAADVVSCFMAVFNSAGISYHDELVKMFANGCHACSSTPCACQYDYIVNYKS